MRQYVKFFMLTSVTLGVFSNVALANEDGLRMGIGAGYVPDYQGSDEYKIVPMPNIAWKQDGYGLKTSMLGLEADLLPFLGFDAGPILRYNMGRSSVQNPAVNLMSDIDGTFELGAYVSAGVPISDPTAGTPTILTARLETIQGVVGGHNGNLISGSIGVVQPFNENFTAIANVTTSYMSETYADTFFGVSAANSAASGLAVYNPQAGFKDVGATLVLNYKLTDQWSSFAIGSYTKLLSEAAASPIVKDEGSANQFFGGIGVTYKLY